MRRSILDWYPGIGLALDHQLLRHEGDMRHLGAGGLVPRLVMSRGKPRYTSHPSHDHKLSRYVKRGGVFSEHLSLSMLFRLVFMTHLERPCLIQAPVHHRPDLSQTMANP